ncbi:hypothetical protein PVAND_016494 [Polypedilum vanderplanki]|uniref:Farnesoic acid O-methyl transferase domain-containing protein n=1 Tax=Polypedilum vanderplanki TaxID=319348 RepID=A0A9J6BFA2_POLVA|nr:hypothetical protein PVAND_016494 [Polypedilum vanderplanki]
MKLLIFCFSIIFLTKNSSSQFATCFFGSRSIGGISVYSCGFSIEGHSNDEIIELAGNHTTGMNDENVLGVINIQGSTNFMPKIICTRFPNVQRVQFHSYGLLELNDESLQECRQVVWLAIRSNPMIAISEGTFANLNNLIHLDLGTNTLTSLPETILSPLVNLQIFDIRNNHFSQLPDKIFNNLQNLRTLLMQNTSTTFINPLWFENTPNIVMFHIYNNQIREINSEIFSKLPSLENLSLNTNRIQRIGFGTFSNSRNITILNIGSNNITEIIEGDFVGMENLRTLQLFDNPIERVGNRSFFGLRNLRFLRLENCRIRNLEINAFEGLEDLSEISLSSNLLDDLQLGIFAPLKSLTFLGYSNNRFRFLRRNIFGDNLASLINLDLNENRVNAIERSVIEEAVNLNVLHFGNNVCESGTLSNFVTNRVQHMARLERCFRNFDFLVDTITENSPNYNFHSTSGSGFMVHVYADSTINIALTPFNFPWTPMIEIIIGAANNTRSIVRRNSENEVVVMPTLNVLEINQWNDFQITWANHVILVSKENQMPFLAFSMQDIFNVNFYGVRTIESRAIWTIVPVGF